MYSVLKRKSKAWVRSELRTSTTISSGRLVWFSEGTGQPTARSGLQNHPLRGYSGYYTYRSTHITGNEKEDGGANEGAVARLSNCGLSGHSPDDSAVSRGSLSAKDLARIRAAQRARWAK